ncbi:hypothetical protein H072_10937 [Dactylellina haptotyla CBS 200.50]|uniref:Uncharacterized protein n=1 Tax=Dactylellina haptotyla (strain CBS 200.50) TaxID=1284197 RepID=S7ZY10_DACHA|nr:hypothetical protein H072_10937 [Dactylellina haptotyla CBS 200.50]
MESHKLKEWIPPFAPWQHSNAIPAAELVRMGYYSTLEPRANKNAKEEIEACEEIYREWKSQGGFKTRGLSVTPLGGTMALMWAEGPDPVKQVRAGELAQMGFILDGEGAQPVYYFPRHEFWLTVYFLVSWVDLQDGDAVFATTAAGEKSADDHIKDAQLMIDQMKARIFIDMTRNSSNVNFAKSGSNCIAAFDSWADTGFGALDDQTTIKSLGAYLDERFHDAAAPLVMALVNYSYEMNLSEPHLQLLSPIARVAVDIGALINDWVSASKEWKAHALSQKAGLPVSAVFLFMEWNDLTFEDARTLLTQVILEMEDKFVKLCKKLQGHPDLGDEVTEREVAKYMNAYYLYISGCHVWHMVNPRYQLEEGEPLAPQPEHKIDDLPRPKSEILKNGAGHSNLLGKSHVNGNPSNGRLKRKRDERDEMEGEQKSKNHCCNGVGSAAESKKPWILKSSKLSDKMVMASVDYIASMPSKKIRQAAVEALDYWYRAPKRSVDIIQSIIDRLHTSSLITDDVEDSSPLRRGYPAAHMVFGTPQAINSANYLLAKCVEDVQKLSPGAIQIYADELCNLHVGQGMDLHWTFQTECPSEEDYIKMIDGKTGGLFRMASRLMRLEATQNKNLEVEQYVDLMSRFFQIRDDYQNIQSAAYSAAKGDLSDLDEGKYSFMLIHALNNTESPQLRSLLILRSQQGSLSKAQKDLIVELCNKSKSMEYTLGVLEELQGEMEKCLEEIEDRARGEKNYMLRAILAKLRV